jgi:hypothetical protein
MNQTITMTTKNRTYSELVQLKTFEERYEYLALRGEVGQATFGFDRWINQQFYTSREWRRLRRDIIVRDESCDLGVEGYDIHTRLIVHHMNPLDQFDIVHGSSNALDPEYLICTTHETHNAIHYGDASLLAKPYQPRQPGDTKLW